MRNGNGNEPPDESPIDSETAAAYLKIHPKTLERMARKGDVPATKYGRSWQFSKSLLREWLMARMNSNLKNPHSQKKIEKKKEKTE
jgi:excisionase family DNA binding protein